MAVRLTRPLGIVLATAALTLGGCAAPGFRADVARFQAALPAPQGQTFGIVAGDPELAGGIEFGQYAAIVAGELTRLGYRPAAPGEAPELTVSMSYEIDQGRERVRSTPGFHDPWYGSYFGYGRGYYRPVIVRGRHGRSYVYGWHDPFLFGGFGGYDRVESYTVYTTGLDLKIDRAADGTRLFEGRAEAQSRDNNLTQIVPNLVAAMFTGFPGNSGEKVRITVAPSAR
ncbi:MAG: DUF4136 domain-containing protein [Sphingopyxis sp.]|nr:DUF4136 domain-containing protein [Sphingopyxis sp.]